MIPVTDQLHSLLRDRRSLLQDWLAEQWRKTPPTPFASVDLRNAGFKLAPVDTNLFPAGFNNLSPYGLAAAAERMRPLVAQHGAKLVIVPEEHTRNLKYLDAVAHLRAILTEAGAEVNIALPTLTEPLALTSANGTELTLLPLLRQGNEVQTSEGFRPDWILMHNDLTTGPYAELCHVTQPVLPPASMGWHMRKKTVHFAHYQEVVRDFAQAFNFDGWWLQADHRHCGEINFMEMQGVECVATNVEKLIAKLKEKYREAGVTADPYVFIKANSGTYGMGIMTARGAEEILEMNRKNRKKMHAIKGGSQNTDVIIQEGIPTLCKVNGQTAEPMVYLATGQAIGGAWRVHESRDAEDNLNAVGMHFHPFPNPEKPGHLPVDDKLSPFYLVAELAALAAAREVAEAETVSQAA